MQPPVKKSSRELLPDAGGSESSTAIKRNELARYPFIVKKFPLIFYLGSDLSPPIRD